MHSLKSRFTRKKKAVREKLYGKNIASEQLKTRSSEIPPPSNLSSELQNILQCETFQKISQIAWKNAATS